MCTKGKERYIEKAGSRLEWNNMLNDVVLYFFLSVCGKTVDILSSSFFPLKANVFDGLQKDSFKRNLRVHD